MGESVYKIIELVGTSTESWEKAAAAAVEVASQSLRDLSGEGEGVLQVRECGVGGLLSEQRVWRGCLIAVSRGEGASRAAWLRGWRLVKPSLKRA